MNQSITIVTVICCCLFLSCAKVDTRESIEQRQTKIQEEMQGMMQEKMQARMQGQFRPKWTPTRWQNNLPPITVKENNKVYEYSFVDLIKADGYLCPGSARAYKTLQVALPLLYENSTPVRGDFKITYGNAPCSGRVFKYFMNNHTSTKYLEEDTSIMGRSILISRLSTGKKVKVTYKTSKSRGHDPMGAQEGNIILHAEQGNGMKIEIE